MVDIKPKLAQAREPGQPLERRQAIVPESFTGNRSSLEWYGGSGVAP